MVPKSGFTHFLTICGHFFFNKDNKITNRIERNLWLESWINGQYPLEVEKEVPSEQFFISISGHLVSLFFFLKKERKCG